MNRSLVSIIIPVYNAQKTISVAVESIIQNNYPNLEIILIDDGSSDESLKICRQLAKKSSKTRKIKVFHQSNRGASAARNLGIAKASGELLSFVDSDDEIAPDFISTLVELIQQPDTALAGTGILRRQINPKKPTSAANSQNLYRRQLRAKRPQEPRQDYILWLMLQDGRLYPVANKIFRADLIRQNHLQFNEKLSFAEDTEFVLQYLAYAPGAIRFDLRPLYIYNLDRTAGTVGPAARNWQNWQISYDYVKNWLKNPSHKTYRLLHLLKLRWHISHLLAYFR